MMTIQTQYYMNCCPCLFAKEMCEHVEGNGTLGCLAACCCGPLFQCYIAPKIAKKSGFDESTASAVAKTVCCCTGPCYGGSITLEYLKQKKLAGAADPGKGDWMVTISDWYYLMCCPCLVGRDMFEHVGQSRWLGCLTRCFLPPVFLCCVGPKIAAKGKIPDECPMPVLKTICPCTAQCYAGSVYAEYMYQKHVKPQPGQVEMQ